MVVGNVRHMTERFIRCIDDLGIKTKQSTCNNTTCRGSHGDVLLRQSPDSGESFRVLCKVGGAYQDAVEIIGACVFVAGNFEGDAVNKLLEAAKKAAKYLQQKAPMTDRETVLVAELQNAIEEAEKERLRIINHLHNQVELNQLALQITR